jgi:hypothetical protein
MEHSKGPALADLRSALKGKLGRDLGRSSYCRTRLETRRRARSERYIRLVPKEDRGLMTRVPGSDPGDPRARAQAKAHYFAGHTNQWRSHDQHRPKRSTNEPDARRGHEARGRDIARLRRRSSRFCALALPNARCVSLCARRHRVQRHPLCQPVDVPCCAVVTARTLAAAHRSPGQTTR